MFTGSGLVKPFPVGTVIRWTDADNDVNVCGQITAVRSQCYTVKNGKGELRAVNINDNSVRVVRTPPLDWPPQDMFLCDLNEHVNKVWDNWKAS